MIDSEGCYFFGKTVAAVRAAAPSRTAKADFLAYVALSQACTDDAKTVCDEARYRTGAGQHAPWIKSCDAVVRANRTFSSCEEMARFQGDYETAMATRRNLKASFLAALNILS
jgi:hypothetical protein